MRGLKYKRFKKKIDEYFTSKLIEEIEMNLLPYFLRLKVVEKKNLNKNRKFDSSVYLYINHRGTRELKEPILLDSFGISKSFYVWHNEKYIKHLIDKALRIMGGEENE